jgi:hypothetical protein
MDGIQMYARSACTALSGCCLVCVLFIFYAASASCREGTGGYVNVKEESLPLPLRVNIWTIHDAANTVLIVPLFNKLKTCVLVGYFLFLPIHIAWLKEVFVNLSESV